MELAALYLGGKQRFKNIHSNTETLTTKNDNGNKSPLTYVCIPEG